MVTETLLNSLKSLFSSLGAKTTDNNYAVGLFDKTSGEPKGMMGMSNLASLLGGVMKFSRDILDNVAPGTQREILDTQKGGLLIITESGTGKTESVDIPYYVPFEAISILGGLADVRRDSSNSNILMRNLGSVENAYRYSFLGTF